MLCARVPETSSFLQLWRSELPSLSHSNLGTNILQVLGAQSQAPRGTRRGLQAALELNPQIKQGTPGPLHSQQHLPGT